MTEAEKIRDTQDFISREIQRQVGSRIDVLNWEQIPHDRATCIHRLVLFRGGGKSIFTFTEYELRENYNSKEWEKRMRDHISDVMSEL